MVGQKGPRGDGGGKAHGSAAPQRRSASTAVVDMNANISVSDNNETPRAHYGDYVHKGIADGADMGLINEVPNMLLLVLLYMIQGVPLGLTMGSIPMLLSASSSFTQIGVFTIASYPYSFKLLWSPVVDAIYSPYIGRRKSWIVPIQLGSAALMLLGAPWVDSRVAAGDVEAVTLLFFALVLLAATQDIAVDGWALTLLSRRHIGHAATCQTLGMNIGYFASFTVFVALNDADFCNRYIRPEHAHQDGGIATLAGYLRFWAAFYVMLTIAIWLFKPEHSQRRTTESEDAAPGVADAYKRLWDVVRLPSVRRLAIILVSCRLAFLPAEAAAPLKLLEKGVSKEVLASLVLLQFPVELVAAVFAGRWAAAGAYAPWVAGYSVRLAAAAATTALVAGFPPAAVADAVSHPLPYLALAALGLVTAASSTVMFTAIGALFNRISDPAMGGAYLTMLNTIANFGITLPKLAIFAMMDAATVVGCRGARIENIACSKQGGSSASSSSSECVQAGGECFVLVDGFYLTSAALLVAGVALALHYRRALPLLEALRLESWRACSHTRSG